MSAQARRQLAVLICWSTVLVWSTSWAGSSSSSYRISFLSISESGIGFPGDSDGKESACKAGDAALIPRSGRSSGGGSGNPLQCSCLENPVDRGAKWATVHGCKRVGHAWLSDCAHVNPGPCARQLPGKERQPLLQVICITEGGDSERQMWVPVYPSSPPLLVHLYPHCLPCWDHNQCQMQGQQPCIDDLTSAQSAQN